MGIKDTLNDAMRIMLPSYKSMRDVSTSGQLIETQQGRVGFVNTGLGEDGKQVFKKSGVTHWRLWAEHNPWLRTAIDIHRNFSTVIEPAVVPIDYKKPFDAGIQREIEDLLSQRQSSGDSYPEVKAKMLEDYFVLSAGMAEIQVLKNMRPYDITSLDSSLIGFIDPWKGKPEDVRYIEMDKARQRVARRLPDMNVMALINRKRSYDALGLSHVEILDQAVQGLFAGDDQLLSELKYPSASGALSLGEGISPALSEEVRAKIMAAKHAFLVVSGTKDPKFINFRQRDIKMVDKLLWFVREVAMLFGLPITVFAQSADSTRANTVALLDQMGEGLKDTATAIKRMENMDIVRKYGDPRKFNLQIDYPILRSKDALKQAELTSIQTAGQSWVSINEARRDNGQDKIDLPIADQILIQTSKGVIPLQMLNDQVFDKNGKPKPPEEFIGNETGDSPTTGAEGADSAGVQGEKFLSDLRTSRKAAIEEIKRERLRKASIRSAVTEEVSFIRSGLTPEVDEDPQDKDSSSK